MTMLYITCPATKKPLETGISLPPTVLAATTLGDNCTSCPHCGGDHVWGKDDVFYRGERQQRCSPKTP